MRNRPFQGVPSSRRVRRQSHWIVLLGVAQGAAGALAAGSAAAAPAPEGRQGPSAAGDQDSRVLTFSIGAGPLDSVLAEFQRVTGLKVVVANPGLNSVQSPGVSGSMTPVRAMETLLRGTSVRANFTQETVRLELQGVAERVDVAGRAKAASPKYQAPLRDTPQTVVVIPQQIMAEQNATSLREVLRNTPGITMSIGEGGSGGTSSGDNILIRGFGARNDIYVDGARDVGLVNRDAFNTESVEVAKGPTSVTGGRGVTGGSINLVTKTPSLLNATTVRATAGSSDYGRATFDVNRKVNNHVAFRLNGVWQDAGYPGRDVAKNRTWGIAPSLVVGLNTPTQLTVSYSRMKQDNIPDWGIPTLLPDTAIARGITVNDLDFSNFYGIASRDYEKTTSDLATVTLDRYVNRTFTLRNLTRYGKNYRDMVATPPRPVTLTAGQGSTDPGFDFSVPQIRRTDTKYQHRDDRVVTNQSDVTAKFSTGRLRHNADVGLEVAFDKQPTYAFTDLFTNGRPPVNDLFNPTPYISYSPALAKTGATSDADAQTLAVYAFDVVKFNDHWEADFGARWDRVNVDYTTVSAPTAAAPAGVTANFGRTDRAFTGRTGLIYKPVEKGTIYAAFSTSFMPSFDGTLGLTLAATGLNSQGLAPERTRNIEAGTKWDVGTNVQLTAAVFQIEKTNAKTVDLNGATVLAGDQEINGVELGLSGNLTPRWGAFGGISIMSGEVKGSGIISEVGARLPYVPKASLNLWTSYRLPMNLTVGGGVNYNSGHYFNQTGTFNFVAGGTAAQPKYATNAAAVQALTEYWLFNAVAMYPVNKHLTLQVNGTNLGNERYADRAYDRHFLPGPTRQVVFSPVITW